MANTQCSGGGGLGACPLELFLKLALKLYLIKCVLTYSLAYSGYKEITC